VALPASRRRNLRRLWRSLESAPDDGFNDWFETYGT
jgi:hypothetical protein